jgi:hypothetical protein
MAVNLPLTGAGGTTASVATEQIGGQEYQYFKLTGSSASTATASVLATTPGAADAGLVIRPIGSTAFTQAVVLTLGTTNTFQFMQSIAFSSGNVVATTVNTSADASVIAANANRKALVVANLTTAQVIGIGLTTAALTTARANCHVFIPALSQIGFGLQGNFPLYTGPLRGLIVSSTVTSGGVAVTEYT